MFEHNIKLLSPWLRETVLKLDEKELWKRIKITYNDEGYPICCYHENVAFQINSIDPLKEAKIWCDQLEIKGKGAIFIYGSGFGYPIFEIFKNKQPHTIVVVFEQNLYLFSAMLHYFDFEPIIKTQKIVFLIGNTDYFAKAFDKVFLSIAFAGFTSPALAFTNIARRNFKHEYLKIHKYIFSQLGLYVFYIGNDHLDNLIGFNNLLENVGEIIENPFISCLKDTYKDVPAFIIANGPSLDKNIKELSRIQDKGLIISTESAIVPLLKNKITPDILTIIERTKYTYIYHFENIEYPREISLLSLGLIDKKVFPSFPGQRIPIFRNLEAINQWINKYLGDGSAMDAGANVSHLAFEIAVYLGANPIIFVGQDYAYGTEGTTHSKDSVYLEEKGKKSMEIMKKKPVVYVEDNQGDLIASNQLWTDFRRGLEMKIASHPEKTIINSTEGGSRIKGTTCKKLSEAIDVFCKKSIPCRVNDLIARQKACIPVVERIKNLKVFINNTQEYASLFRELSQFAYEGKLKCREVKRITQSKNTEKYRDILEKAYHENINAYQRFIEDDLLRCFCQQVIFAYYYFMNCVGLTDTPQKIAEIFEIQYSFFDSLNTVCQSLSVHFENAVDHLNNVLEKFEKNFFKA